jgi:hypothetical protein
MRKTPPKIRPRATSKREPPCMGLAALGCRVPPLLVDDAATDVSAEAATTNVDVMVTTPPSGRVEVKVDVAVLELVM